MCILYLNRFSVGNKAFLATKQEKFSLSKDEIMKVFYYKVSTLL